MATIIKNAAAQGLAPGYANKGLTTPIAPKATTTSSSSSGSTLLPTGFTSQQQFDTFYNKQSTADQAKLSASGYSMPKPVQTSNITPIQNPTNLGNLNVNKGTTTPNTYGDVRVGKDGRQAYTGTGVQLSTGEKITDLSTFGGISKNKQEYDVFGKNAEKAEVLKPGFLAQRNDVYAMDILKNNPTLNQANADEIILKYIQTRDTNKQLDTANRGDTDVQNTIAAIRGRMGSIPQAPNQQQQLTDQATALYDKKIGQIESQKAAEESAYYRNLGGEDRYTNFNEINDRTNSIYEIAGKHKQDNLYTGFPTDQQIEEIAQKAGQDFATTKKTLEGRGWEDLQMQGEFAEKSSRPYDRQMDDLETDRSRAITDAETSHTRTQTALNEQIDDVKTQMERNIAVGEKQGAMSGAIRSSGYMQGLENIRNDAIKNMGRLETRKEWDTSDTAQLKNRITETYNTNITRSKQDLETKLNEIKTTNGAELNQYLNQYSPSSTELSRKLDELQNKFGIMSQEAFSGYMSNLRGITDTMTYDTEKVMELQKIKQGLQQTNINNLLANNGMALGGMNYSDIGKMLQTGDISPTDYTTMTGYMKGLGLSTLQSLGRPTAQDISLYNQMLEGGSTPQQAIATITSQNPSRFTTSTNKIFQTLDPGTQQQTNHQVDRIVQVSNIKNMINSTAMSTNDNIGQAKAVSQLQDGTLGGQCGEFVNDINQAMEGKKIFGNTLSSKVAQITDKSPKVGSYIVMDTGVKLKDGTPAGHVGYVQSINSDGTLSIKDSNWNGDEKISTHNVASNDSRIKGYVDPNKAKGSSDIDDSQKTSNTVQTSQGDGFMSSIGVPVAYERRIKNMVPATLMNSEIELEQLNKVIKSMYDGKMTPEQAVLTYLGVDIPKQSDKEFAGSLITTAKGLTQVQPNFYSNLSDFINKGQREQAVMYLEREAINQAQKDNPDLKFSDAGTSFAVKQGQEIKALMDQYTNQFGPIKGKWNDLTKGLFGNKEAQTLATKITQAISKMRNDLVGSQITGNEKTMIKELIPSLDETADTAYIKTQNLIDTPLSQYNQARSYVGLPTLDEKTLLDRKLRLNLYSNTNTPTQTNNTTTTSTGGGRGL